MPPLHGKMSSYESSDASVSSGSIELLSKNRKNDDDYNTDDEEENDEEQGDNENHQNNGFMNSADYDGDYTANDFSIQNRVMHFLYGDHTDNKRNRQNVEISLLIEAGTSVTEEKTITSQRHNQLMLDKYVNIVRNFKPDDFVSPSLQEEMATKLYNAKAGLTGERLWAKFMDWRKEIRMKYSPKLSKELSSLVGIR